MTQHTDTVAPTAAQLKMIKPECERIAEPYGGHSKLLEAMVELQRKFHHRFPDLPGLIRYGLGEEFPKGSGSHTFHLILRNELAPNTGRTVFSPSDKRLFCDYYTYFTKVSIAPEHIIDGIHRDPFQGKVQIKLDAAASKALLEHINKTSVEQLSGALSHMHR